VEQATGDGPAIVGVEGVTVVFGWCGDGEGGRGASLCGPGKEVAGVSPGGRPGGQPGVDVLLGAAGECEVVVVEPVEEGDSGGDLVAGVADRGASGRGDTCCSPSQAAHGLPCGEGVHQPSLLGVVDPGDGGGDPLFEPGDRFVAFGEGAVGDEELADVAGRSRAGMGVERVVGQRHRARRQRGEDRGAGALTDPVERGERRVGGGDGVTHGDEGGGDFAVGTGEQHGDTTRERAVGAAAAFEQPVLAAALRTGRCGGEPGAVTAPRRARTGR
jgi:hypothetical protein